MIALAGEIADGMVFANGARSHMADSLAALPAAKRKDAGFFIGNMIPTCISDDIEAAKAVNRKTLTHYALLPNYRNYWKEAGYVEEMDGDRDGGRREAHGRRAQVPHRRLARRLHPVRPRRPRARGARGLVRRRRDARPSSCPPPPAGNQMKAIEELFATFTG